MNTALSEKRNGGRYAVVVEATEDKRSFFALLPTLKTRNVVGTWIRNEAVYECDYLLTV